MKYSQGWLVGQDGINGYMIPFEICMRQGGTYKVTATGPWDQELLQSFMLCLSAVQLVLHSLEFPFKPFDCHLHFPLHRINGSGISCRLALAYSLLEVLGVELPFPASATALTGNINLNGDVFPVDGTAPKIKAAHAAGFKHMIVSSMQPEYDSSMLRINHLTDLMRRYA
ncbi:S16 family serine protease [Paenibacillus sp. OSY-SE]|uniref:S16 family serine protease n=1 Tax=Paenibacillus sp. OSY-SE TaxID=1196323 RepID=UPI00036D01ED|nr:S16 family serine protease [Paenibacillus sp. OSY-SE]